MGAQHNLICTKHLRYRYCRCFNHRWSSFFKGRWWWWRVCRCQGETDAWCYRNEKPERRKWQWFGDSQVVVCEKKEAKERWKLRLPLLRWEMKVSWPEAMILCRRGWEVLVINSNKIERPKFCIHISRKEKEEDFMTFLGRVPRQRPAKRPKKVQKQINVCCIFYIFNYSLILDLILFEIFNWFAITRLLIYPWFDFLFFIFFCRRFSLDCG